MVPRGGLGLSISVIAALLGQVFAEVEYVCFSRNESSLRLRCPVGYQILLEEARFGRSRWGACLYLEAGEPGSGTPDCSQLANEGLDCCGRTTCSVPTQPVHLPICGYKSDFLRIVYQCVKDTNVTCGPRRQRSHEPSVVIDASQASHSTTEVSRGQGNASYTHDAQLVLQDFRRMQDRLAEENKPTKRIFGYKPEVVIAFFTSGAAVILILSVLLLYVSRRPVDSYKCSTVPADTTSRADSRKDDLMETMFFDEESVSADSRSTRSEAMGQLNDAYMYEMDVETNPKKILTLTRQERSLPTYSDYAQPHQARLGTFFKEEKSINNKTDCNVSPLAEPDMPPTRSNSAAETCSPAMSVCSVSSGISLPDADDEREDSGVETAEIARASSESPKQNSPPLHPGSVPNDSESEASDSSVAHQNADAHCSKTPPVCSVIIQKDQDAIEC